MLGRRPIDTTAPFRSSLANAAFAVEERVVWGGVDVLRRVLDAVKWPFERVVWAIERSLVWPLEERTGDWGTPLRAAGVAALALLAAGAGVLGLVWASGSGSGGASRVSQTAAPASTPIVRAVPQEKLAQAAPALQGTTPDFSREADGGVASGTSDAPGGNSSAAATSTSRADEIASSGAATNTATSTPQAKPAGPAAIKVANRFAGAFVLYEIGKSDAEVRSTFAATATPQLTHALLRRPPRLPADAKVPKAKVLNVVPGPVSGNTYAFSVSLLRVGVTSELRIDMQRDEKTGQWRVVDALG
jgi:hypothetical protein